MNAPSKINSASRRDSGKLDAILRALLGASPDRLEMVDAVLNGDSVVSFSKAVEEPFLTLRQLSNAIGIGATTLWRYQVPGHVLGGRPRYKRTEVEEYLRSGEFKRRAAALRAERKKSRAGADLTMGQEGGVQ